MSIRVLTFKYKYYLFMCVCACVYPCLSVCFRVVKVDFSKAQYAMQSAHTVSRSHGNHCPVLKAFLFCAVSVFVCVCKKRDI